MQLVTLSKASLWDLVVFTCQPMQKSYSLFAIYNAQSKYYIGSGQNNKPIIQFSGKQIS